MLKKHILNTLSLLLISTLRAYNKSALSDFNVFARIGMNPNHVHLYMDPLEHIPSRTIECSCEIVGLGFVPNTNTLCLILKNRIIAFTTTAGKPIMQRYISPHAKNVVFDFSTGKLHINNNYGVSKIYDLAALARPDSVSMI